MGLISERKRITDILPSLLVVLCGIILFAFPAYASAGAKQGTELCLNVVVPSLFPFFVLSNLICRSRVSLLLGRIFSPLMKFFSLPSSCGGVFLLGLLSGFPVGAEGSVSLVSEDRCSKGQAERLLALSNNSSPAFIISAAGAGLFGSVSIGWTMFFCQLISIFIAGFLTSRLYREKGTVFSSVQERSIRPFPLVFTESVVDAFFSVMKVCSFVIFFIMLTNLPVKAGVFGVDGVGKTLLSGFLEMTSGFGSLSALPLRTAFAFSGFFLGWAGLSVHCQVAVFALKGGLSLRPYLFTRILQATICGGLTFLSSFFFFS